MAHPEYDLPILAAAFAALIGCTLCWGLGYGGFAVLSSVGIISATLGWSMTQAAIGLVGPI